MVERVSEGVGGGVAVERLSILLKTFVRDLLAALVLFPVSATYLLSYTALVYSGPLAFGRPAGLAAMLVTSLVAGLVTGLASSFRFASGTLDNNATAIMATVAASLAAEMGERADPNSVLATVIVGMAIAGLAAGTSLLAIGLARAGAVVRLLPLQVMAGFLGTTGWILASGGLRVSLGRTLGVEHRRLHRRASRHLCTSRNRPSCTARGGLADSLSLWPDRDESMESGDAGASGLAGALPSGTRARRSGARGADQPVVDRHGAGDRDWR